MALVSMPLEINARRIHPSGMKTPETKARFTIWDKELSNISEKKKWVQ